MLMDHRLTATQWGERYDRTREMWAWAPYAGILVYVFDTMAEARPHPSGVYRASRRVCWLAYEVDTLTLLGYMLAFGHSWAHHLQAQLSGATGRYPYEGATYSRLFCALERDMAVPPTREDVLEEAVRENRVALEDAIAAINDEVAAEPTITMPRIVLGDDATPAGETPGTGPVAGTSEDARPELPESQDVPDSPPRGPKAGDSPADGTTRDVPATPEVPADDAGTTPEHHVLEKGPTTRPRPERS